MYLTQPCIACHHSNPHQAERRTIMTTTDRTPDQTAPSPSAVMTQMMAGFQVSQALYVIAKLDIPTLLDDGPLGVQELAERTGAHQPALRRLIRTLTPLGIFTTRDGDVSTTPLGAVLSRNHPESMHAFIRFWMETHYLPFSTLLHTVRTGEVGTTRYLGKPFFEWITDDPDRAELMSRAMADVTAGLRTGMFDDYELPAGDVVADIGGGDGSILLTLLKDRPERRGIVFDLPAITPTADASIAREGLADRVETVAGDFLKEVPTADIYILGFILHDWDDETCGRILQSIRAAAKPGARLLIIEGVVPPGDEPHLIKMIDLTMLGLLPGREREADEYRDLLATNGFTLDRIVGTVSPLSIIEATVDPHGVRRAKAT
jgi:DNA-binding Lrp family transcriptional regulator